MRLSRRDFIKKGAATSFILTMSVPDKNWQALADSKSIAIPTHYVEITKDGRYLFVMDKAEMGQGVITGQLTMFCEEANMDPKQFEVKTAPVAEVYATFSGMQITGGSSSTPDRWLVLRQAGANLNAIMTKAASTKWSIPVDELESNKGTVYHRKSQKKAFYSELISEANQVRLSQEAPLKSATDFKLIGKPSASIDAVAKSTGQAEFGIDFEHPGLLIAVVERCPSFGGSVRRFDDSEAKKVPGFQRAFEIDSGVAIVCEKYWQATKARQALKVEWNLGSNQNLSSQDIRDQYSEKMENKSGTKAIQVGDHKKAIEDTDSVIEAEYFAPYLAHATMEPMNATAWVQDDKVDVWVPNQGPTLIRNQAAKVAGVSRDQVQIHTTKYLGGGFGRRSTLDYPTEAVEISKEMKKPIKVIWSREDDTKFSPMRPLSLHKLKAGIKNKVPVAWHHRLACESIMGSVMPQWMPLMMPGWMPSFLDGTIGSIGGFLMSTFSDDTVTIEGADTAYNIPNRSIDHYSLGLDVPIHFWRSVAHSYNGFVVESFIDEIAHKVGKDPYKFRKGLLQVEMGTKSAGEEAQDKRRLEAVLDLAAKKAGWELPSAINTHKGIACHKSFNSYVAQVAEVEVHDQTIQVKKVTCAIDCGIAVNPDIVKKQMESGIIYGLSAALNGQITLKNGGVVQANFDTYEPLRMIHSPEIEVHIVKSDQSPTGVGEPGLPPIAPAVANAVFMATGRRLRSLPLRIEKGVS